MDLGFSQNDHFQLVQDLKRVIWCFRFLYGQDVALGSIPTALLTLKAAHMYLCAGLVRACVMYLNEHLGTQTVLHVYQCIRVFCGNHQTYDLGLWIASAPPLEAENASPYSVSF